MGHWHHELKICGKNYVSWRVNVTSLEIITASFAYWNHACSNIEFLVPRKILDFRIEIDPEFQQSFKTNIEK